MATLGKRLGKDLKAATTEVRSLSHDAVKAFMTTGTITLSTGHVLTGTDIKVVRVVRKEVVGRYECCVDESGELLVALDALQDEETRAMGAAREVANRVQKLRKKAGLQVRTLHLVVWLLTVCDAGMLLPVCLRAVAVIACCICAEVDRR